MRIAAKQGLSIKLFLLPAEWFLLLLPLFLYDFCYAKTIVTRDLTFRTSEEEREWRVKFENLATFHKTTIPDGVGTPRTGENHRTAKSDSARK